MQLQPMVVVVVVVTTPMLLDHRESLMGLGGLSPMTMT